MFRIWLKNQRKMVMVGDQDWHRYVITLDGRVIGPGGYPVDAVVMRRSNLRDKTGRHIYYGDIVKTDSGKIIEIKWLGNASVIAPEIVDGKCVIIGHMFDPLRVSPTNPGLLL
jgi:hypothetical protein